MTTTHELYEGRYLVVGPPGTGKTTFLSRQVRTIVERFNRHALANWDTPVLVCSLTKAAAVEIAGRDMPVERESVGTLHSHCYHLLGRPRILTRDDVRLWNVDHTTQLQVEKFPAPRRTDESLSEPAPIAEDTRVLTSSTLHGQAVHDLSELLRHRAIPTEQWSPSAKKFHDEWEEFKRERGVMDFTDLIERALVATTAAPGRPWVILVDEAQDLSRIEYALIKRWGERASATILVGDPLQTIYGFRGSDPAIFDDPDIPESHRRVLSQSYRVPRRVLEASVHWVESEIDTRPAEYKPRRDPFEPEKSYDGWVRVSERYYKHPRPFANELKDMIAERPDETFMIQTTCAYMLSGIIGELRYHGIPYANPWKLNRGDWNPLSGANSTASKLADILTTCRDSPVLRPWTYTTVGRFVSIIRAKGPFAKRGIRPKVVEHCKRYEAHPDATPTGLEIEEWFGEGGFLHRTWVGEVTEREFMDWWYENRKMSVSESLTQYLRYIVQERGSNGLREPPRVFVGTCHSFKGAEAGIVYVFPDLSPQSFRHWMKRGSPEHAEIVREFYVAMTRSQEGLIVCRNSSTQCAPLKRTVSDWIHDHQDKEAV